MKKIYLLIISLFLLGLGSGQAQYNILLNFNGPNGNTAEGSLIRLGNKLCGITTSGGALGFGNIFTIDTLGGGYKDLHDFDSVHGSFPVGHPIVVNNKLYGMAEDGGVNTQGCIYSIDTNGAGYQDLFDFNGINGYWVWGSLVLVGPKVYGMTAAGGPNDSGLIFAMDTSGLSYKVILYFDSINKCGLGQGSIIASGDTLYGMTEFGGTFGLGNIFSVDTAGNNFTTLLSFNGINGYWPMGTLYKSGNMLYGSTMLGGVVGDGNVFSIRTDGSHYKDLYDFNNNNLGYPMGGDLVLSGGMLYGMAGGGFYGYGQIFSVDTGGTIFNCLYNFNNTDGSVYYSTQMLQSGNTFYGVVEYGGTFNYGVVFSFVPCLNNNFNEPICIATIDTATNKCELIWGRTNSPSQNGFGNYNIYRDSNSVFELTHTQLLNMLSEYVDMNSNPSGGPVSYKLSTTDTCGESAVSAVHTTMCLTTSATTNAYNLSWTPYIGFTPLIYRIFRGPALNAMVQIDSVPNTVLSFVDSFPPINSYYAVEAVNPFGVCVPTAKIKGHNSMATLSGSFSNGFNTAILGVQSLSNSLSNIKIYPNPGSGLFNLSYSLSNAGNISISIIDELGQVVYTNAEHRSAGQTNEQINLENLSAGIYSLRLQTSSGIMVKKLVVMKK